MFGQDFSAKVWSKDFASWNLIKICVKTCYFGKQYSTLGSVVPLAMFFYYAHLSPLILGGEQNSTKPGSSSASGLD